MRRASCEEGKLHQSQTKASDGRCERCSTLIRHDLIEKAARTVGFRYSLPTQSLKSRSGFQLSTVNTDPTASLPTFANAKTSANLYSLLLFRWDSHQTIEMGRRSAMQRIFRVSVIMRESFSLVHWLRFHLAGGGSPWSPLKLLISRGPRVRSAPHGPTSHDPAEKCIPISQHTYS